MSRLKAGREAFPPRDFAIEKLTDHPAHALAAADDARDRLCVVVVEALRRSSVPGEVVPRLAAMAACRARGARFATRSWLAAAAAKLDRGLRHVLRSLQAARKKLNIGDAWSRAGVLCAAHG